MQKQRPKKSEALTAGTGRASSEVTKDTNQGNIMSDSKAVQVSSQPVFSFGEHLIRVVTIEGDPWFVATDVCSALDLTNPSKAMKALEAHERSNFKLGRQGEANIINESGLYTLILRCRDAIKPGTTPHKFKTWVTSEVLPAIRKTGIYVGKPFAVNPGDVLTAEEQNTLRLMLKSAVEKLPKEKQGAAMKQGWGKLFSHFKVSYRQIPRHEFSEAVSIIARHTAEWELVDDADTKTINEQVARWVHQLESGGGIPVELFKPLFDVLRRKLGRDLVECPSSKLIVDRQKLAAIWVDLGKLKSRVNGLGVLESDLPPSWWQGNAISNGAAA